MRVGLFFLSCFAWVLYLIVLIRTISQILISLKFLSESQKDNAGGKPLLAFHAAGPGLIPGTRVALSASPGATPGHRVEGKP